jgi:hypothetical protein
VGLDADFVVGNDGNWDILVGEVFVYRWSWGRGDVVFFTTGISSTFP